MRRAAVVTSARDPRIGSIVGERYRVLERIAAGGMGVVYRGERLQLQRRVAIRFLLAPFSDDAELVKCLEVEARALSRLSHPNGVSIIDFGVADAPYLVMGFITGKTLYELLSGGPLSVDRTLAVARQMLAGLAHAHKQGIVHRDVMGHAWPPASQLTVGLRMAGVTET